MELKLIQENLMPRCRWDDVKPVSTWIYLIVSFLIVALGQPARIPFLGIVASVGGFACFWRAMLSFPAARTRFILAGIWFSGIQLIQLSWMSTTDYMGPLIVLVYLFLAGALGLQFAALSLCLTPGIPMNLSRCLALAGIWVFFEWTRLFPCTGFTWNPVGLALSSSTWSMQWASVFGVYGLSFWVILVNALALWVITAPVCKRAIGLFAAAALFPFLYGFVQVACIEAAPEPKALRAVLVQTALLPEQRDYYETNPDAYIRPLHQWERILEFIEKNREGSIDLIVLPESALPHGAFRPSYPAWMIRETWRQHFGSLSISDFPPLKTPLAQMVGENEWRLTNAFWVQALSNHYHANVIIGLDDEEKGELYNAAFLFRPQSETIQRYEKRVLVPVSEYVPFNHGGFLARFIAHQFGIGNFFRPGELAKKFDGVAPLSISICYEETFSHLIRESRQQGAELFVNVSNDVWFPGSTLPQQQFDHGKIRAVENGVAILRACNTGVTGGIDSLGRTIAILEPSEEVGDAIAFNLPLRSYRTLYTFWGDWGILFCSGISILTFFLLRKKKLL